MFLVFIPSFVFVFKSVNTALYAISDPVPVVDGIAMIGTEGFNFFGNPLYLKLLPEFLRRVAMPFAKSMVLPPPIEIMLS